MYTDKICTVIMTQKCLFKTNTSEIESVLLMLFKTGSLGTSISEIPIGMYREQKLISHSRSHDVALYIIYLTSLAA